MGIETIAAIAWLAIAAGSGGYQAHASSEAAREAKDEKRDAINAQNALMREQDDKRKNQQLGQANVAARMRQRALASTMAAPAQGVSTNATGYVGDANVAKSTLTGM